MPTPRSLIDTCRVDRLTLERALPPSFSSGRAIRLQRFWDDWRETLQAADFGDLPLADEIDRRLFAHHIDSEQARLTQREAQRLRRESLVPGAFTVADFEAARRRMEDVNAADCAARLQIIADEAKAAKQIAGDAADLWAAAATTEAVRDSLRNWFGFYDGYDPVFSWWCRAPFAEAETALTDHAIHLRERATGGKEDALIGSPIGRDALLVELARERLPYTPDELIAIGEREREWCEAELRRASQEMGHGDDWKAALEQVKQDHVPPGQQPALVRDLAREAIELVDRDDLVTIPPLCREVWRLEMMSPDAQKTNPFFLGGEVCRISFPTDNMSHERKHMSLRGNNRHFARATVQHELIPGHHLQLFVGERVNPHRKLFSTPFYIEGWTMHWEFLWWERGFAPTPEARIGMLFWRLHRCARIVFSLRYHLGEMTPEECVDYLVERVGHEPDNARGEIRRSIGDSYPPLYQAAYLLGGLQMHALYREQVETGNRTPRAFHDTVLAQNAIPIEYVRAALTGELPAPDSPGWKFYKAHP